MSSVYTNHIECEYYNLVYYWLICPKHFISKGWIKKFYKVLCQAVC